MKRGPMTSGATDDGESRAVAQKHADRLLGFMYAWIAARPTPTGMDHYDPRPTDVLVATFPKAGTTLMQNLVYHLVHLTVLSTGVDPLATFTDISVAVPWLEFHPQHGVKLPALDPRIFKTHLPLEAYAQHLRDPARAPRFIALLRSPLKLPASWLDFAFDDTVAHSQLQQQKQKLQQQQEGTLLHTDVDNEPLSQSAAAVDDVVLASDPAVRVAVFHRYVQRSVLPDGDLRDTPLSNWASHMCDWATPPRSNVLVLFYEDVVDDLRGTVRKVAQFLRIDPALVTEEVVSRTAKACDRDVMANDTRFQLGVEAEAFNIARFSKAKPQQGVRSFKAVEWSDEELAKMRSHMKEILGVCNYEEWKRDIKAAQSNYLGR